MSSSLLYYVEYIVYTETQIEQFNTIRRIVKPLGNAVHLVPDYAAALPQSLELLKLIFPATLLGFIDDSVLKNPPQSKCCYSQFWDHVHHWDPVLILRSPISIGVSLKSVASILSSY